MSSMTKNDGQAAQQLMSSGASVMSTMLGIGFYDATEVALLCGLAPDQVLRWTTVTARGDAPLVTLLAEGRRTQSETLTKRRW